MLDISTTNIQHSTAITCLQVIHSLPQLSCYCCLSLSTLSNKVRNIFIVLFNTVLNFRWNQSLRRSVQQNVQSFYLLHTRNTAPQVLISVLTISSSIFLFLQLLRGVILSFCVHTTSLIINSYFSFELFSRNEI